ncbi:hypothetical protein Sfum_1641 [Syntrophobacter fumaroxidans MPOB]|uniref:Uncharacterized protein n=1 Tax=Syntrophobacter fumaroxidans (strain DSM 10017 / MPOB) TaxID=335543 RepID=A0LIS6_SYNFM|nr:hypothetical protein Sfum_1641 [Syntrophobacter fumaroxidans MPOB]
MVTAPTDAAARNGWTAVRKEAMHCAPVVACLDAVRDGAFADGAGTALRHIRDCGSGVGRYADRCNSIAGKHENVSACLRPRSDQASNVHAVWIGYGNGNKPMTAPGNDSYSLTAIADPRRDRETPDELVRRSAVAGGKSSPRARTGSAAVLLFLAATAGK